jgi:hypothetical protein
MPQTPHPFATNSGKEEMPEQEDEIVIPPTLVLVQSLTLTPALAPLLRLTISSQLKQKMPV